MWRDRFTAQAPGRLVPTVDGQHLAFVPNPLPSDLPFVRRTHDLHAEATLALGELRGIGRTLVNPRLVIQPLSQQEAVLSSRIEGTTAGLAELALYRVTGEESRERTDDVGEVANYDVALSHGFKLLERMPICNRLLLRLHEVLLTGVRGQERRPGEFRELQNAIGILRGGPETYRYIPPPVREMHEAMRDLERYIGTREGSSPPLIQAALIHYQFEAIHPFMDGNGRLGRLLIPLFLRERGIMPQPLLYMGAYFERHKEEYKDRLLTVSQEGAWDEWIQFFLAGVRSQAIAAVEMADRLLELHRLYRDQVTGPRIPASLVQLIELLFEQPVLSARTVSARIGCSAKTAYNLIDRLESLGILIELPPARYPRIYYAPAVFRATMPEEHVPTSPLPLPPAEPAATVPLTNADIRPALGNDDE